MDNIISKHTNVGWNSRESICEKIFIDSYSIYKIIVHSFQQIRRRWNFEFIELSGLRGHILGRRTPPYFGDIVWKGMEQENQRQTGFQFVRSGIKVHQKPGRRTTSQSTSNPTLLHHLWNGQCITTTTNTASSVSINTCGILSVQKLYIKGFHCLRYSGTSRWLVQPLDILAWVSLQRAFTSKGGNAS